MDSALCIASFAPPHHPSPFSSVPRFLFRMHSQVFLSLISLSFVGFLFFLFFVWVNDDTESNRPGWLSKVCCDRGACMRGSVWEHGVSFFFFSLSFVRWRGLGWHLILWYGGLSDEQAAHRSELWRTDCRWSLFERCNFRKSAYSHIHFAVHRAPVGWPVGIYCDAMRRPRCLAELLENL